MQALDERPLLICLLPVRNAAAYLPAFFDSLRGFCDGVIALDDGSTDATPDILRDEPLVKRILTQTDRGNFTGWNDAANRNALLRAAGELQPQWIISLDADELIDPADGQALRDFLNHDAIPGLAYGFRNAPMMGDIEHFLPHYVWVYRLFAYERGQRFPSRRLHFVPIPTRIPPERWVKTTIRIKHLGELTPRHRLARFAKYLEADPGRKFQDSYADLLEVVDVRDRRIWLTRSATTPPLLAAAEAALLDPPADQSAAISVILVCRNSVAAEKTIASVLGQQLAEPFELIVAGSESVVRAVTSAMPDPRIIPVPIRGNVNLADARNRAIEQSSGLFVTCISDGEELVPGYLQALLRAHRRGFMMVEGRFQGHPDSMLARCHVRLAWGTPPSLDAQVLPSAPRRVSYARLALHEAGGFSASAESWNLDRATNQELFRRGYLALYEPRCITLVPAPATWKAFLKTQFDSGRNHGHLLIRQHRQRGGLLARNLSLHQFGRDILTNMGHSFGRPDKVRGASPSRTMEIAFGMVLGRLVCAAGKWLVIFRSGQDTRSLLLHPRPQLLVVAAVGVDDHVSAQLVQANYLEGYSSPIPLDPSFEVTLATSRTRVSLANLARKVTGHKPATSAEEICRALATALGVEHVDILLGSESEIARFWQAGARESSQGERRRAAQSLLQSPAVMTSLTVNELAEFTALRAAPA